MVYVFIFCLIIILIIFYILLINYLYGKKYIVDIKSLPKDKTYDAVIILGAGVREDGKPCDILADRLGVGAKVYIEKISKTILLTGESRGENYSEPKAMKAWIIDNYKEENIKEEDLLIDNFGLCTFDSIYRAKKVFNIKSVIISTNKYHLPRALYIARKLGIKAYGIASDKRNYDRMKRYKKRELLAQVKDFFLCFKEKLFHI